MEGCGGGPFDVASKGIRREGSSGWGGVQGQWELSIFIPRSETNRSELMNNEADDWRRDDDGGR